MPKEKETEPLKSVFPKYNQTATVSFRVSRMEEKMRSTDYAMQGQFELTGWET